MNLLPQLDMKLSREAVLAAARLLEAAGEGAMAPMMLVVSPDDLVESRRMLEAMSGKGEISPGAHVQANYLWTDGPGLAERWMLVGRDAVVYSVGEAA